MVDAITRGPDKVEKTVSFAFKEETVIEDPVNVEPIIVEYSKSVVPSEDT